MVEWRAKDENEIDPFPQQNVIDAVCRERNVQVERSRGRVLICPAPDGLHSKSLKDLMLTILINSSI